MEEDPSYNNSSQCLPTYSTLIRKLPESTYLYRKSIPNNMLFVTWEVWKPTYGDLLSSTDWTGITNREDCQFCSDGHQQQRSNGGHDMGDG